MRNVFHVFIDTDKPLLSPRHTQEAIYDAIMRQMQNARITCDEETANLLGFTVARTDTKNELSWTSPLTHNPETLNPQDEAGLKRLQDLLIDVVNDAESEGCEDCVTISLKTFNRIRAEIGLGEV